MKAKKVKLFCVIINIIIVIIALVVFDAPLWSIFLYLLGTLVGTFFGSSSYQLLLQKEKEEKEND